MEPNSTPPPPQNIPRLKAIHGVLFSLACAVSAETVLGPLFNDDGAYFSPIGRIAIVFLSVYTLHRFALTGLSSYKPTFKDLCTLALVIIGSTLMVWTGRIVTISLVQYLKTTSLGIDIDPTVFDFAMPYAAGALLLQAVRGLHYGLVFSLAFALIIGTYSPWHPILFPFVLSTCIMACLNLSRFRSRSAYIKAGLNIAIIALPFALASIVIDQPKELHNILIPIGGVVVGGVLCTFLASGVTPIVEALGGYVTDMRLLEMATLDHPLLKEMSIQAPGTWNHSMVIGMMVDRAADAVGANSVLARVGAYFHDIGKMKKPLYFVENQAPGDNRHDKLSSSMSALIIRSHVKDGIELAKKHKLPKAIIDMIPQHHGTSLIEYFYSKAKKEAKELEGEEAEVDKSLYQYPGPKPQTREAGILLLADGIEAAARTLSEPTQDRIQGMVQKLINKVFASGQLNECDLTLKDLHLIAKSFTQVLTSIHHQRIAYAEPAEKGSGSDKSSEKSSSKNGDKAEKKEDKKSTKTKSPQKKPTESKDEQGDATDKSSTQQEPQKEGVENKESSSDEDVERDDRSESSEDSSEQGENSDDNKEDLKRLGI